LGFNANKLDEMTDEIHKKKAVSINGKNPRKTAILSMKCTFDLKY